MKLLSQGVKVGVLVLLLVVGSYVVWKSLGSKPSGEDNIGLSALFRDASGLPVGSRVMIAGLPVGEITQLGIEGRYARLTFHVRDDIVIWSNAVVFKKASSLLGAYYLEIDPGTREGMSSEGVMVENVRVKDGDTIDTVMEATTPDALMKRIEESLPNVDKVLVSVHELSENLRELVNGPLAGTAARIDDLVQRESDTVRSILERTDRIMARIEDITGDIRTVTGAADSRVARILDELEVASREARQLMTVARAEVEQTGDKVREKLDLVDETLMASSSVARKIDGNQGTLGRLVNDPAIADNVEEITDDAKDFVKALTGMQTYVGLRSEYNVMAGLSRHYVTVELATRPDKYYYIELEQGPRGQYPEVTLDYDPSVNPGGYVRRVTIKDEIRFTLQYAKRIGWATFRFGLKESTGGIGFDIDTTWLGKHLRINTDLFDGTFDQLPRLKISAAYEVFRNLYLLGGIDEVLNEPDTLPIVTGPLDVPVQFEEFRFGRDFFVGAMLRFNDRDLVTLMSVGGSALASAVQ